MGAWEAARKNLPGSVSDMKIKLALGDVIHRNPDLDQNVWIGAIGKAIEVEAQAINKGGWLNVGAWVAVAKSLASGSKPTPGEVDGALNIEVHAEADNRPNKETGPQAVADPAPPIDRRQARNCGLADKIYGKAPKASAPAPRPREELRDLEPKDKVLAQLDALGLAYEGSDSGYRSRCPNHRGSKLNFEMLVKDDGRVLLCCQAFHDDSDPDACTQEAVVAALGLEFSDLYPRQDADDRPERGLPGVGQGSTSALTPSEYDRWAKEAAQYEAALTGERLDQLAGTLKVSSEALRRLHVGWKAENRRLDRETGKWFDDGPAWTFPERDAQGRVIGIQRRFVNPTLEKKVIAGSRRGLYLPDGWSEMPGPVIVPEGASDVAALLSVGRCAVGRPNVRAGIDLLVELFGDEAREVVVAGENDEKLDGTWPGRAGAVRVSEALADRLGRAVKRLMPPPGFKDLRDLLAAPEEGQPDVD